MRFVVRFLGYIFLCKGGQCFGCFGFESCGVVIVLGRICGFTSSGVVRFQWVFDYWVKGVFFWGPHVG